MVIARSTIDEAANSDDKIRAVARLPLNHQQTCDECHPHGSLRSTISKSSVTVIELVTSGFAKVWSADHSRALGAVQGQLRIWRLRWDLNYLQMSWDTALLRCSALCFDAEGNPILSERKKQGLGTTSSVVPTSCFGDSDAEQTRRPIF